MAEVVTRHYSMNPHPVCGYTMFSFFSFRDGKYRPGQCQACPTADVQKNVEHLERTGWTHANAVYGPNGWELQRVLT